MKNNKISRNMIELVVLIARTCLEKAQANFRGKGGLQNLVKFAKNSCSCKKIILM
jgi:hypothetical protein